MKYYTLTFSDTECGEIGLALRLNIQAIKDTAQVAAVEGDVKAIDDATTQILVIQNIFKKMVSGAKAAKQIEDEQNPYGDK